MILVKRLSQTLSFALSIGLENVPNIFCCLKQFEFFFFFLVTWNTDFYHRQISMELHCWSLTFHSRATFSCWVESDMIYRQRALHLKVFSLRSLTFICHAQNKTNKTKKTQMLLFCTATFSFSNGIQILNW